MLKGICLSRGQPCHEMHARGCMPWMGTNLKSFDPFRVSLIYTSPRILDLPGLCSPP